MTIQGTVEGQITAANSWASEARQSAISTLEALAAIDIPTITVGPIPYTPMVPFIPAVAVEPEEVSLEPAPEVAEIADVERPEKPELSTIELGEILAISIPELPIVEFPSINFEPPEYEITKPTNWAFSVSDILITDDPLLQVAITRLKNNIENGGTGLTADVEEAIWNRERERNERQLSDSTDKTTSMWAKKNWSLPDGLLAHSLSELQTVYMEKSLDRSRDIAIEQGKLEQSNLFKSLEMTVSLAATLINMLIRYEELVLRSQEDTAKFANEYIDLQIKTYASLLEAYKARAQVYEISIRTSLAKVELYKAQIEGQRLIGDVNKQTVEIYVERLRGHLMLIEQYKTEVDAMTAELNAERVKVEANKIRLDAWAKEADVKMTQFGGRVELFRAVAQQNISTADLEARQAEANLRTGLAATELAIKGIDLSNRSLQAAAQIRVEAARGIASAAATMAAGAMAGVTTGASMSYGESMDLTPTGGG